MTTETVRRHRKPKAGEVVGPDGWACTPEEAAAQEEAIERNRVAAEGLSQEALDNSPSRVEPLGDPDETLGDLVNTPPEDDPPSPGHSRGGAGTNPQTEFGEVVLDMEENLELYTHIEIKEANAEAHKNHARSVNKIKKILFEDMGLKDGADHVLRINDKKIVITGATGEVRTIEAQERQPITKIKITNVSPG